MRVLDLDAVAIIKASQGYYRAADVARATGVHRSTIARIWAGAWHRDVEAAREVPNISHKVRPVDYQEDIRILLSRGMTEKEVAVHLGISVSSVNMYRGVFQ